MESHLLRVVALLEETFPGGLDDADVSHRF